MTEQNWVRPSRCGNTNCVEVAKDGDEVLIRDSKHPEQAPLRFTRAEWDAFTAGVRAGEFRVGGGS